MAGGYQRAGAGDLDLLREADPDLVAAESAALGAGLRAVFDRLPEGGRALVVGHSPTNEAAVLGLSGEIVPPLGNSGLVESLGCHHYSGRIARRSVFDQHHADSQWSDSDSDRTV